MRCPWVGWGEGGKGGTTGKEGKGLGGHSDSQMLMFGKRTFLAQPTATVSLSVSSTWPFTWQMHMVQSTGGKTRKKPRVLSISIHGMLEIVQNYVQDIT